MTEGTGSVDLFPRTGQFCKNIHVVATIKTAVIQYIDPTNVESIALLQRMSNTRSKEITLDVDMEDYHRIKSEGR